MKFDIKIFTIYLLTVFNALSVIGFAASWLSPLFYANSGLKIFFPFDYGLITMLLAAVYVLGIVNVLKKEQ